METVVKKLYEAMFLVDSAEAAADFAGVNMTLKNILQKADAEIVSIRKWDECKLAYQINGKTRGTYILCYFRANGERIGDIERDVRLSEKIMRVLILSTEQQTAEDIEKDTPATKAEKHSKQIAKEAAEKAEAVRNPQDALRQDSKGEQISAKPVEEAEEPEQPAIPAAADTGESEQPEQADEPSPSEGLDEQSQEDADTEISS